MFKSILDTDLYKFSTSYAYFKLYPLADGTFTFNDRNREDWGDDKDEFMSQFMDKIRMATELHLSPIEKEWCIEKIPYIPQTYWEWLDTFRFDYNKVKVWFDDNGVFNCSVTDKLYKVTFYEILVLATYSELRNLFKEKKSGKHVDIDDVVTRTFEKVSFADQNGISFSEFGTRRRYSSEVHEAVVETLKSSNTCAGTSNVHYARKYNMKPIGTFPHEWIMFHAACFGYKRANYLGLEDWIDVYHGDLGISLVDTYTTDSFLRTLTKKQAYLLSGFRQDSGDEFAVGNKIIRRLKEFGIDPTTKTIVFSNALDMLKANTINNYFKGKCRVSFGIGTNLTCDTNMDWKPANIVMKLSRCRLSPKDPWENCIKISDDIGKHMGDNMEFDVASKELKLNI